jgi:hypothetical protein
MIIERADADDLGVILTLRTEASEWLAQRGIDQWAVAWPNPEQQNRRILTSIEAGETWMIRDENEATMATVALDTFSDPRLWTPDEQADPAMYMHRLIVRRKHAGLGSEIMDWACHRAHRSASTGSASTSGPTTPASTTTTSTTASNTSAHLSWPTIPQAHYSSGPRLGDAEVCEQRGVVDMLVWVEGHKGTTPRRHATHSTSVSRFSGTPSSGRPRKMDASGAFCLYQFVINRSSPSVHHASIQAPSS